MPLEMPLVVNQEYVVLTHDFGRYTCAQYRSSPAIYQLNLQTVQLREHRKLHYSIDENSCTTFNFTDADARVGLGLATLQGESLGMRLNSTQPASFPGPWRTNIYLSSFPGPIFQMGVGTRLTSTHFTGMPCIYTLSLVWFIFVSNNFCKHVWFVFDMGGSTRTSYSSLM